jgi:hypothetical protein
MVSERNVTEDDYPDFDDEQPVRLLEVDPISEGIGSPGFVSRYEVSECRQPSQAGSLVRYFPERFDRFYFQPIRLLVDLVQDGSPEVLRRGRASKHCDFKAEWCAKNDWRYIVVPESISGDPKAVRALLASGDTEAPIAAAPAAGGSGDGDDPTEQREPVRKRGTVSRPKAAA